MKLRLTIFALLLSCATLSAQERDYTEWVDPFIGTADYSATHPGAVVPHGMMAAVPFNVTGSELNRFDKDNRWWSTPYDIRNKYSVGFAHGALSGVGCPELGAIITMATTGTAEADRTKRGSTYRDEVATPGYYATTFDKFATRAEATATERASVERYTFTEGGEANIIVDLGTALSNESGAMLRRVSNTEVEGMRLLGTFCYNSQAVFPVYFVARISTPAIESGYWKLQPEMSGIEAQWSGDSGEYKLYTRYSREIMGNDIGAYFRLGEVEPGTEVEVKIGISYVSMENARQNLDAEVSSLTFDEVHKRARAEWNKMLGRIRVNGGSDDDRTKFYTALYHALLHPNILSDVNGEYPAMESNKTLRTSSGERYTVFSLWDTYRNVHQLMTLVYPERQVDMVRSMIDMYREWGWMPKWELYGRETFTMEGDPSIPVITDTWLKGLRDFDIETAYEAFVKSATTPGAQNLMRPDIDPYLAEGYVPLGLYSADASGDNSVSHALEYYIADYALSLLAEDLGHTEDAARFRAQSLQYKHYYCPTFGTLRPLNADGSFLVPFNPRQGENFEPVPGFHEGSAWNYTFYVPHDVLGLAKLMGGRKAFVAKLQKVFDEGLYDPANEPDIAYPYLFSRFRGEEWRTHETVATLLDKHYTTRPDGLPGNDDTGTMSAWAVFSMMGIYPDCPGEPTYTITTPVFDKVQINTPGEKITIECDRPTADCHYIDDIEVNGKQSGYRITHKQLLDNANIKLKLKKEAK